MTWDLYAIESASVEYSPKVSISDVSIVVLHRPKALLSCPHRSLCIAKGSPKHGTFSLIFVGNGRLL